MHMVNVDSYRGCLLGLALGDASCAPYEGGLIERLLWRFIGKTKAGENRYTDDTQMSLDVAKSFFENTGVDQDHLARTFASSYKWSRGYGPGTAGILKNIKNGVKWQDVNRLRYPQGSYGNGAAMRAPVVALYYYGNEADIVVAVQKVSEITHAHPLAIEGARLVAVSTSSALDRLDTSEFLQRVINSCESKDYMTRMSQAAQWIEGQESIDSKTVSMKLGNGMAAIDSCVTAIYVALRFLNSEFSAMIGFINKCSGDTDTIGAMAGAIWGAFNGLMGLSHLDVDRLEAASEIKGIATKLFELAPNKTLQPNGAVEL